MGTRVLDPKTGEVRDLPADQAEAEFKAGRAQLPVGSQIPLADAATGKVMGRFAPDKVSEGIRDGVLRFATDGDLKKEEAENQPVRAFAEGFFNDVTLPGALDLPAAAMGADMEAMNARRETSAGKAGSIAGMIGGLFIPGSNLEHGVAAVGARGAARLLPSALAETAGRELTKAAESALSKAMAEGAARKAIASGLGHAVVGAGVGALGVLDEAALGNTEASTETILSGMGAGGLIGGGLGAVVGGVLGRQAGKVDGRVAKGGAAAAREAEVAGQLNASQLTAALEATGQEVDAKGMTKWFPAFMAKAANNSTGVAEEDVLKVMSPKGRAAILQGEKARDAAVKYTADLIDNLDAGSARFNLEEARLAPSVLAQLPKGIGDTAITEASSVLGDARRALRALAKDAANYGKTEDQMTNLLKPVAERLRQASRKVTEQIGDADDIIGRATKVAETSEVDAVANAAAKMKEAKATLQPLGAGFARAVFDDNGDALKIAKKASGIAQNRSEVELSSRSAVLNPVIEHAPDYSWVKQAKVKAFNLGEENLLAEHLGIPGTDENWLRHLVDGKYEGPRTPALDDFEQRINSVLKDLPELDRRDLGKAGQWGINSAGEPVLIDYGFQGFDARSGKAANMVQDPVKVVADSAVPVSDKAAREIYRELDQVYRVIAGQEKKIKPILGESAGLRTISDRFKASLQDTDRWGGAARAHRELSEAALREEKARETLSAFFPLKGGKVDRQAVAKFTKEMDRVTGDNKVSALAEWVDAQNKLADTAREHMDVSFAHNNQRLVAEYGEVYNRLREDVLSLNAQDRLLKANRAQGFIPGLALGSVLSTAGLGGAGYAAGNAVGNAILNPGRSSRQLAAMLAFKSKVAQHIQARAERLLGADSPIQRLPVQAPKWLAAMIDGTPAERQAAYAEHREELEAVSNPDAYVNQITPQLAPLADAMPAHATQMVQHGQKMMAVLANEAPKPVTSLGPQAPYDFLNPPPSKNANPFEVKRAAAKPHPDDIRRYGQTASVVIGGAPAFLELMEKGQLRAAHISAFKQLYPNQDAELTRILTSHPPTGKMTAKAKKSVMMYLNAGAPDPAKQTLRQSIYAEEIQEGGAANLPTPNPRAPKLVGPLSTATDRTANFPFPTQ